MSKFYKVEVTKIYTVEIDDDDLTEQEKLDVAIFRVLDEIDELELSVNSLNVMKYSPDEVNDMIKACYTPLDIKPKEYYGSVRPI